MDFLMSLWLPIVLSAVAVWFAALIVWMALPHHKRDFIVIPPAEGGEDGLMEYLRKSGVKPGNYVFPDFRGHAAMESEKVQRALREGPVGHLSVWPTPLGMGGKMVATFFVYLVISVLVGYLTRVAVPGVAPFARVFQIAGTAGVLAYSFSFVPNAIWFGAYKRTIIGSVVDGIVFGLVTGAIFAWRWPH
jgi:hypothetical protein